MPGLEEQGPGGGGQPACDLLLLDEEDWLDEAAGPGGKKLAGDMLRLARRLGVPAHKREWAIEAGGSG